MDEKLLEQEIEDAKEYFRGRHYYLIPDLLNIVAYDIERGPAIPCESYTKKEPLDNIFPASRMVRLRRIFGNEPNGAERLRRLALLLQEEAEEDPYYWFTKDLKARPMSIKVITESYRRKCEAIK